MSNDKRNAYSDIFRGIAEISLASVVIPFVFDRFNLLMLVLGVLVMLGFWFASIKIVK